MNTQTLLQMTFLKEEEYPVYSLSAELYPECRDRFIMVSPEELYTAWMYDNLREEGQTYHYSTFMNRLTR